MGTSSLRRFWPDDAAVEPRGRALTEAANPRTDETAVSLELRLAGPRRPMPPLLSFRCVQPRTRRVARCSICAVRLAFAFVSACSLGEDVKNQARAVDHAPLERLFEIALLGRAQAMIDQDDLRAGVLQQLPQLLHLAGANEEARVDLPKCGRQCSGNFGARRQGERIELCLGVRPRGMTDTDVNKHGQFAVAGPVKQAGTPNPTRSAR